MRPSIISFTRVMASALLAVGAGQAMAQTEFSYQGVLDFSYGRFEPSGFEPRFRFNSNSMSASFVGATLKHGLDDGWTPGLTVETFLRFQDLRTGRRDSDPLLSRNAFAFLNSRYGNLRVGRVQTLLFDTTSRFNALGNAAAFSPAIRHVFLSGNLDGVQGDFYWNRAVAYSTPNFDGLTVNAMVAQGPDEQRGQYRAGNVVYNIGLLAVSLSGQKVHVNDGIHDPTDEQVWQAAASYNFGWARLFAMHTRTRDPGLEVRSKISSVGVSAPVGPGTLQAQIAVSQTQGIAVDRKHTSTSAAYLYAWDSLTDLYVASMEDRVQRQTRGLSYAVGVRYRLQ